MQCFAARAALQVVNRSKQLLSASIVSTFSSLSNKIDVRSFFLLYLSANKLWLVSDHMTIMADTVYMVWRHKPDDNSTTQGTQLGLTYNVGCWVPPDVTVSNTLGMYKTVTYWLLISVRILLSSSHRKILASHVMHGVQSYCGVFRY